MARRRKVDDRRALLLPPLRPPPPAPVQAPYTLDPSQLEAATWNGGPLLIDAGPGTGKTRTAAAFIKRLFEISALFRRELVRATLQRIHLLEELSRRFLPIRRPLPRSFENLFQTF